MQWSVFASFCNILKILTLIQTDIGVSMLSFQIYNCGFCRVQTTHLQICKSYKRLNRDIMKLEFGVNVLYASTSAFNVLCNLQFTGGQSFIDDVHT